MKNVRLNRREILEKCIVKGLLVAGVPMSASNLLALWQKGEHEALKPTPDEVLGPFFKKGAPNVKNLRAAGDAGVPFAGERKGHQYTWRASQRRTRRSLACGSSRPL